MTKIPSNRHYSFGAIDVGFDLRVQGMPIDLPTDATSVRFDVAHGESRTVAGDRDTLASALHDAGYAVVGYV